VPALAVPVDGLPAAVGASRVISRVHYPSDVLAGFVLGTAASRGRPRASAPRCGHALVELGMG